MNKKKLGTGLIALALVGVIGVGGSLAWFTDNDTATNTFTVNHVDIELTETSWGGNDQVFMPGATITKNPVVTLADESSNAYVRINGVQLVVTPDGDREPTKLSYTLEDLNVTLGDGWKKGTDGYYYYQTALSNDSDDTKATTALFESITLPGKDWNNQYAGATVDIEILAEAIQADNYTPTVVNGEIVAWDNAGTIEAYTLTSGN